jgi:hypothetical protein
VRNSLKKVKQQTIAKRKKNKETKVFAIFKVIISFISIKIDTNREIVSYFVTVENLLQKLKFPQTITNNTICLMNKANNFILKKIVKQKCIVRSHFITLKFK